MPLSQVKFELGVILSISMQKLREKDNNSEITTCTAIKSVLVL